MSSKTTATKRCGSAPGFTADASGAASAEVVVVAGAAGGMAWESGVSTLKLEITCGLRLSATAKSSFFKLGTTLPWASRTTTRTSTRLTRTLKVAGVSWVETSEELLAAGAAGDAGCAGAESVLAGGSCGGGGCG